MLNTKLHTFNLEAVHPSWKTIIKEALARMNQDYLEELCGDTTWLPGHEKIFNAFSLPLNNVQTVLFGESPYPRAVSANGYAFWDANVGELWSPDGLNKAVNRATSLRNTIKMLLVAEEKLEPQNTSQEAIKKIDKSTLISTNNELFANLIKHGFLLLNATPVLYNKSVRKDAVAWHPFIEHILTNIIKNNPTVQLLLLGNIANTIDKLTHHYSVKKIHAEHPYNLSFITNPDIITFFKPMHLLLKNPNEGVKSG